MDLSNLQQGFGNCVMSYCFGIELLRQVIAANSVERRFREDVRIFISEFSYRFRSPQGFRSILEALEKQVLLYVDRVSV